MSQCIFCAPVPETVLCWACAAYSPKKAGAKEKLSGDTLKSHAQDKISVCLRRITHLYTSLCFNFWYVNKKENIFKVTIMQSSIGHSSLRSPIRLNFFGTFSVRWLPMPILLLSFDTSLWLKSDKFSKFRKLLFGRSTMCFRHLLLKKLLTLMYRHVTDSLCHPFRSWENTIWRFL